MDRKLLLVSRLLQRFCVRTAMGLDDSDFTIGRTPQNKPYLVQTPMVRVRLGAGVCACASCGCTHVVVSISCAHASQSITKMGIH